MKAKVENQYVGEPVYLSPAFYESARRNGLSEEEFSRIVGEAQGVFWGDERPKELEGTLMGLAIDWVLSDSKKEFERRKREKRVWHDGQKEIPNDGEKVLIVTFGGSVCIAVYKDLPMRHYDLGSYDSAKFDTKWIMTWAKLEDLVPKRLQL